MPHKYSRAASAGEDGYSVFELLIAMLITVVILVGALNIFDLMSEVGRTQADQAGMQQAMRVGQYDVVRMIRMTGRGGLVRGTLPAGIALTVRNNVADGSDEIAPGTSDSPKAALDTDILALRGVFNSPLYQLDPTNSAGFTLTGDPPTEGQAVLLNTTPTGVPVDLNQLEDSKDLPEALLIVSPLGEYAVVELKPGQSVFEKDGNGDVTKATLNFFVSGGTYTNEYTALNANGVFPDTLRNIVFLGVLEEYRFYSRHDTSSPMLSRARVYPGTDEPYEDKVELLQEDIAENVLDFQVALGVDKDRSGDLADDEWLFDDGADNPAAAEWNDTFPPILALRLSTLARTDRPVRGYTDAPIAAIEDRSYGEPDHPTDPDELERRRFRRRVLATTVDLRNL